MSGAKKGKAEGELGTHVRCKGSPLCASFPFSIPISSTYHTSYLRYNKGVQLFVL